MQDSTETIHSNSAPNTKSNQSVALAQQLLMAMREGELDQSAAMNAVASLQQAQLSKDLSDDQQGLAFWINLYNAFNLYWMRTKPVSTIGSKKAHFFEKRLEIAGHKMSLNDIEHGILRRSKTWWGRGYFTKWFPNAFEKQFRVKKLDPRIHFALNCGANGCPPIRFYSAENMEAELTLASRGFMLAEVREEGQKLAISRIFWMYKGDFGGRKGIANWIIRYRKELATKVKGFGYFPYDDTENLDNFVEF